MSKINYDFINNNFVSNSALKKMLELDENKEAFTKAINGAVAPQYTDLAELQDSGNSSIYNQALHDVVMGEVYKTTNLAVENKIGRQQLFINDIRKIINDFRNDFIAVINVTPSDTVTKIDLCNDTLAKITNVLNTRDTDGKYLLGGVNSTDVPCIDLTTFSNLDAGGNILNNYTTSASNTKEIVVSHNITVKVGFGASNKAFSTLIGAINRIKNSANVVPTTTEIAFLNKELNDAVSGIDIIESNIINTRESIESAKVANDAATVEATSILASPRFTISTNKLVEELMDYARSHKILQSIVALNGKISNDLLRLLPSAI